MGSNERKERHTKTMRERILKAAMALFAKKGYEHVSMRRIAKKIEYCPATIYRYFKNKEDIMLQLCYQGFEKLLARQVELDKVADPLERLRIGSRYYTAFAVDHPDLYELMFATKEIVKQPKEGEESVALKSFQKLVDHVQECIDAGYFPGEDAERLAIAFWAGLHGLSSLLIKGQLRFLPQEGFDRLVEEVLSLNLREVKGRGPTSRKRGL
jgi:AcrR family transcriptional regulator